MTRALFRLAALTTMAAAALGTAHAGTINFIALTETGGYGESAWTTLKLSTGGVNMAIRGYATNDTPASDRQQYAYLDWGNAGLGVCKDLNSSVVDIALPGNTRNRCQPSSDDNVTRYESLSFVFDQDVLIANLWFNNNHDGGFGAGDQVSIAGTSYAVKTGYANGANGIGAFLVPRGYDFRVGYANEEFYVSAISVSAFGGGIPGGIPTRVPEPASLALAGLALCGLATTRRRRG